MVEETMKKPARKGTARKKEGAAATARKKAAPVKKAAAATKTAPAKKPAAAKKAAPVKKKMAAKVGQVPAEQRSRMIAEAAYYRAEARGFDGGDPVADWLSAEAEVDAHLAESK